jgi:beta-lactam-binding protein with PASTA domain
VKSGVIKVMGIAAVAVFGLLVVGCGGSGTPDTEGQTLAQAQQTLRDAGVPEGNITVTGESGDPNDLIVCDHDPDGVEPSQPLTLEVAQSCPQEDDSDSKRKKRKRR